MIASHLTYHCVRSLIVPALFRMLGQFLPESITTQSLRTDDSSCDANGVLVVKFRPNVITTQSRTSALAIDKLFTKCRVRSLEDALVAKTLTGGT